MGTILPPIHVPRPAFLHPHLECPGLWGVTTGVGCGEEAATGGYHPLRWNVPCPSPCQLQSPVLLGCWP